MKGGQGGWRRNIKLSNEIPNLHTTRPQTTEERKKIHLQKEEIQKDCFKGPQRISRISILYLSYFQAGTTCGASSQADVTQNLVLKTRMLRFSRHLRQKCRKRSFLRQQRQFFASKTMSHMSVLP